MAMVSAQYTTCISRAEQGAIASRRSLSSTFRNFVTSEAVPERYIPNFRQVEWGRIASQLTLRKLWKPGLRRRG
jgi:hypothetical protein